MNLRFIFIMLGISLLSTSCATNSALISEHDAVFKLAQQRFQNTEKTLDTLHPSHVEKLLFLQAESFYRYRFSPPKRSTAKYLAEAASAITDFPGFQSLAGSLDMEDLRFRSADSAVQLWETLLQQHPKTSLRPLILYRLGWAYRNIGAQGLPRSSPNDAFNELIQEYPHSKWATWAKEAQNIPWKSKESIGFRSIIPGLGQFYLGENQSGWTRLGVALAGVVAVALPAYAISQKQTPSALATAGGLAGLIMLSFDFTSSYEDAMHGVVRWNERAEALFHQQHPETP